MFPVHQSMAAPAITVRDSDTIEACARLMHTHRIRHLPMVDAEGKLTGLVTDFDVFMRGQMLSEGCWAAFDDADRWLLARHLSHFVPVRAGANEPLLHALDRLISSIQDLLVVVDAYDHPIGVLSEHDIARMAAQSDREIAFVPRPKPQRLHTIEATSTAVDARDLMLEHHIRHILVCTEGRLVGVLSFRDVAVLQALDPALTAGELVRRPPLYTEAPVDLRRAAAIMSGDKVGCLPIVDEHMRPLDVVTRTDIMQAVANAEAKDGFSASPSG